MNTDDANRSGRARRRAMLRHAARAPDESPGGAVLREALVSVAASVAVCALVGALLSPLF